MKASSSILYMPAALLACICIASCSGNGNKEKEEIKKDTARPVVKKAVKPEPEIKYQRPPIINIVDTVSVKRIVVFAKDSAKTFDRISLKLGKLYGGKLADVIKKNNLKTAGAPMAWFKTTKAPYFFEAGAQVNKRPSKFSAGVQVRELNAGKVVLAHFYGPYELLPQGYDALKEWMKDNKKTSAGAPYEIYVTDPVDKNGKPIDPYKVQTDIVFPIK